MRAGGIAERDDDVLHKKLDADAGDNSPHDGRYRHFMRALQWRGARPVRRTKGA